MKTVRCEAEIEWEVEVVVPDDYTDEECLDCLRTQAELDLENINRGNIYLALLEVEDPEG